jgi:hypothetical protein
LANSGILIDEEWASWRRANDRYDSAYVDPTSVDATIYDREKNPTAQSWFKRTATHLPVDMAFYTDLLDRHGVEWTVLSSDDPGIVLYEDDVQIVVVPRKKD